MMEKIVAGLIIAIVITAAFTIIAIAMNPLDGADFFEVYTCVVIALAILAAVAFVAFKLFPWAINTLFGG